MDIEDQYYIPDIRYEQYKYSPLISLRKFEGKNESKKFFLRF